MRLSGVFAPVVLLLTTVLGVVLAPSYRWPTDPVSEVGALGNSLGLPFGIGLTLSGILILAFSVHLWRVQSRFVGAMNALAGLGILAAGLFPVGSGLHEAAALYFFTAWLPPLAAGILLIRDGRIQRGVTFVGLGLAAVAIWLPYDLGLVSAQVGLGAAEFVTFIAWGCWSCWMVASTPGASDRTRDVAGSIA